MIAGAVIPASLPAAPWESPRARAAGFVGDAGANIAAVPVPGAVGATGALPATYPAVNAPAPAATAGAILRSFGEHIYFRVWAIPPVLDAQNPKRNTPIPFQLWNAFLTPNELQLIDAEGDTGLTLDFAPLDVLDELELRTVNVTITPAAPIAIDASYLFDFALDDVPFRFLATLADILPVHPNTGIKERLEWKTEILPGWDGTEQRIALRARPRRTFNVTLTLENDAERKALYDSLYKTLGKSIILPTYQYSTRLKANVAPGATVLPCNPKRADLRVNDTVVIQPRASDLKYVYNVTAVAADSITIDKPLTVAIAEGAMITGGVTGRLPNGAGLRMYAKHGGTELAIEAVETRDTLAYPENGIVLPTLGGYPIVERRALADSEVAENFDFGLEVIDNDTGRPKDYTAWEHKYFGGSRRFLINRLFKPDELEYWRTVLDYARGMQRAFILPTYRDDLIIRAEAGVYVGQITVEGSEYATLYAASPNYKYLRLDTNAGEFFVEIFSVTNNGDSVTLNFVDPIPADIPELAVNQISYAPLVRLNSDAVTLTHGNTSSTVEFDIRAAG